MAAELAAEELLHGGGGVGVRAAGLGEIHGDLVETINHRTIATTSSAVMDGFIGWNRAISKWLGEQDFRAKKMRPQQARERTQSPNFGTVVAEFHDAEAGFFHGTLRGLALLTGDVHVHSGGVGVADEAVGHRADHRDLFRAEIVANGLVKSQASRLSQE